MAITYIEQFVTRRAHVEMSAPEGTYAIDYTVVGPVEAAPTEITAAMSLLGEEGKSARVGYATYASGASSVRFDSAASVPVTTQVLLSAQFYNDMQSILV